MRKTNHNILKVIFAGIVGFINGFFGGGGGLVCVPTLEKIYKLPTKKAHATAVCIMFPLSIASSIIYIIKGSVTFQVSLYVTIGVTLGGLVGAFLLKKSNTIVIKWLFIAILYTAGIRMIIN